MSGGKQMATPTENVAGGLPPSNTVRWSPQRKASVVEAVRSGLIGLDEACRRYQLSAEEFLEWQQALKVHGIGGLSVTRSQYLSSYPQDRWSLASSRRPRSD
jgi:transposase-like protein